MKENEFVTNLLGETVLVDLSDAEEGTVKEVAGQVVGIDGRLGLMIALNGGDLIYRDLPWSTVKLKKMMEE